MASAPAMRQSAGESTIGIERVEKRFERSGRHDKPVAPPRLRAEVHRGWLLCTTVGRSVIRRSANQLMVGWIRSGIFIFPIN